MSQAHEATPSQGRAWEWGSATLAVAILSIIALALRFWHLGDWGLDSDEVFTLRDSIRIRPTNPRPLGYLLNHYLVLPLHPLDEFGLRVLPAFFGALAIPVMYLIGRRLIGNRAAILGALLLAFSPLHVIYSQFGRYWAMVFLFSAIYPYAFYLGLRQRNRSLLVLGVVTGVLAVLAHPAAVLLVGGPALWFLATQLRGERLRSLWTQPRVRWGVLGTVLLLVLIAIRFVPILQGWIAQHDAHPGTGQFLLAQRLPPGLKQLRYLLQYVEGWTFQLVLISLFGLAVLWQGRDRALARFLITLALFPALFLPLLSLRTPISTYYLVPIAPVFFFGAGVFLDHVFSLAWKLRPWWLGGAAMTAMILAAGTPTLLSQYRNGRRFDFRGVANWVQPRLTPRDVIYSDQPAALGHYLPGSDVRPLKYNTAPLTESLVSLRQGADGAALWVVAPAPAHAFRTNLEQGGLADWLYQHCQLRNIVGRGRLDFRQQYLQVYHCPPEPLSDVALLRPGHLPPQHPLEPHR
ncbi:MAG TPA: glycosyltransferase family 39 protein [Gemmatimonadales bacterium]|nr:glycosyltransferase family 39 protein [Gemmatimonadales bacterium]